jgi:chromosome partitioning protein
MKVIVFGASKGGVGKTTLLFNVATYAASTGRGVLIADLDPQGSLREMWTLRNELVNPRLVSKVGKVAESVALLTSAGYDKDFFFVDTPGSLFPVIRDAVSAADLVVLPTRPNPVDLRAQEDVINVVDDERKLGRSLFVLNQTEKGDLLEKAKAYLAPRARHPVAVVPKRVEYARAAGTSKAAWEVSKDAKADTKRLWEAMLAAMTTKPAATATEVTSARKIH